MKWERKHAKREQLLKEHSLPPSSEVWDPEHAFDEMTKEELLKHCIDDLRNGVHCLRPRLKWKKPPRHMMIKCQIAGYTIMDAESDPYCSYIVVSRLGSKVSMRYRRYNQFKDFHKSVCKKLLIKTPFPPPNSLFGGRNLTPEYLSVRQGMLQQYLNEVCENPDSVNNLAVMEFFGFIPIDDFLIYKSETRAIDETLLYLDIPFLRGCDNLTENLIKITIHRIKRELWEKIVCSAPPAEKACRSVLKRANKEIDSLVVPIVEVGIRSVKEACYPMRKKLLDSLPEVCCVVKKAKDFVVFKLKTTTSEVINPILTSLSQLIDLLSVTLTRSIIPAISVPIQAISSMPDKLMEYFATNDDSGAESLSNRLVELRDDANERIKGSLKDAVRYLVGAGASLVSHNTLEGIIPLLENLADIVFAIVIAVFNPVPWFHTLQEMILYKDRVDRSPPTDIDGVMRLCDEQENSIDFIIECDSGDYLAGAETALNSLEFIDYKAGKSIGVLYKMFEEFRDVAHSSFFKRFCRKFGDYIWGTLNLSCDSREWKDKVNHSFALAFRSAVKHTLKRLKNVLHERICNILEVSVINAIEEYAMPRISDSFESIKSSIPDAAQDFLDIEEMARQAIRSAVHECCMNAIEKQSDLITREFSEKVGIDLNAPIMPSLSPFPYGYESPTPGQDSVHDSEASAAQPVVFTGQGAAQDSVESDPAPAYHA